MDSIADTQKSLVVIKSGGSHVVMSLYNLTCPQKKVNKLSMQVEKHQRLLTEKSETVKFANSSPPSAATTTVECQDYTTLAKDIRV